MKAAFRLLIAASALAAASACKIHESIQFTDAESHTVRLLDASSGRVLPNVDVTLRSGSAIGCVQAPCPPGSADWTGRADSAGRIIIPKRANQPGEIVVSDAYVPDLLDNATKRERDGWDLELTLKDSSGNDPYPLKLFDGSSKKPLVNKPVRLEFTDPHGVAHNVDLVTNALGYIFVSYQIAAIGKHSLIRVHRYDLHFVRFADTHHNLYFSPRTNNIGSPSTY